MAICGKCGSSVPDGVKFCTECGNTMAVAQPNPAQQKPAQPKPEIQQNRDQNQFNRQVPNQNQIENQFVGQAPQQTQRQPQQQYAPQQQQQQQWYAQQNQPGGQPQQRQQQYANTNQQQYAQPQQQRPVQQQYNPAQQQQYAQPQQQQYNPAQQQYNQNQYGAPVANPTGQPVDYKAKAKEMSKSNDYTATMNPNDIEQNKTMAILAYFGPLLLIPLFAAKTSPYARFHTNQGLVLATACVAWSVITSILSSILGAIHWILGLIPSLLGVVNIVFFVLAVIGIINAAKGQAKTLPIVGQFKILK